MFAAHFLGYLGRSDFLSFKAEKFPASFEKSLPMSSFSLVPLRDPRSLCIFCDKKNFASSWMRLLAPACQNSFVHYFFLVGPTSLFICSIIYIIGKWSYILLISLSTVQLFLVLNKKQQPTGIQRFSSLFEGPTCSFLAQFSGSFNQKRVSKISRDSLRFAVVFWSLPKLYKQE